MLSVIVAMSAIFGATSVAVAAPDDDGDDAALYAGITLEYVDDASPDELAAAERLPSIEVRAPRPP
jgi:hypothetical protein